MKQESFSDMEYSCRKNGVILCENTAGNIYLALTDSDGNPPR